MTYISQKISYKIRNYLNICSTKQLQSWKNTWRLFHILTQFLFTTSETKLDYYHQKVSVRVTSRVAEGLKTQDLRKLGNFKKVLGMIGFGGECLAGRPNAKIRRFC